MACLRNGKKSSVHVVQGEEGTRRRKPGMRAASYSPGNQEARARGLAVKLRPGKLHSVVKASMSLEYKARCWEVGGVRGDGGKRKSG